MKMRSVSHGNCRKNTYLIFFSAVAFSKANHRDRFYALKILDFKRRSLELIQNIRTAPEDSIKHLLRLVENPLSLHVVQSFRIRLKNLVKFSLNRGINCMRLRQHIPQLLWRNLIPFRTKKHNAISVFTPRRGFRDILGPHRIFFILHDSHRFQFCFVVIDEPKSRRIIVKLSINQFI